MEKFKPDLWSKSMLKVIEDNIPQPKFERVKYYQIKRIMNKIFRTKFKLCQRDEETVKIIILRR